MKLRFSQRDVRPSVCVHNSIAPATICVKFCIAILQKKKKTLSGLVYKTPTDRQTDPPQLCMALSTADTRPQINSRDTKSQWMRSEVSPETHSHTVTHLTNYKCPVRRHRTNYKCPVRRYPTKHKCPAQLSRLTPFVSFFRSFGNFRDITFNYVIPFLLQFITIYSPAILGKRTDVGWMKQSESPTSRVRFF